MRHLTTLFCIAVTLASYVVIRRLYLKYNNPLFNIVALSAAIVICVLVLCGIPYNEYVPAKDIMTILLGPATVGLALPLYRYRHILKRHAAAIVGSVALGSLLAMLLASLIAKLGGLPEDVVMSIMPKGVSIPFAIEITQMYGGIPALTAAFVVATGTLGSLMGAWSLTTLGIGDPIARGLALGTMSHAQGTAIALMEGERQGAMAGLAMILAGILTAGFSPLVVRLLNLITAG